MAEQRAKHADRFPMLNKPDPSYHGAVWTQAVKPLGPIAYIIKARVTLLRDMGRRVWALCLCISDRNRRSYAERNCRTWASYFRGAFRHFICVGIAAR
jgi:hypothetical protein